MSQAQKMALKPGEKLVTRLFLSPNLQQNLNVLAFSAHDLINALRDLSETNPFVSLKVPKNELQNLDWIQDDTGENLVDHLLSQVNTSSWSKKEQKVVKYLIYQLDNDGYLRTSLAELSHKSQFSRVDLQNGVVLLHQLDPCGIGAKDLNECLLLQAQAQGNFDSLALQILEKEQLALLAEPERWVKINADKSAIEQALKQIQTLKPNPASEYQVYDATQYLIPDLTFSFENGNLYVSESRNQLPELVFDQEGFVGMQAKLEKDEAQFLTQQKKTYLDMKKAIEQRQATLLRLGKYVGNQQLTYLQTLKQADLQPLGLKETAQALGLAPSTISRAIKDKYVECQGQIFSLKLLFPRNVKAGHSQNYVSDKIVQLIKQEDPASPLSDAELAAIFAKDDFQLSRRVIAKYRQKLGIKNSYQRQRKDRS